jgi:phosphate-selective porin OprO/OprP
VDPQNLLIRNVHLIDPTGAEDTVAVNMLIQQNRLELVSRDAIPAPQGVLELDATGGFLIGALEIGAEPRFIILDQDPRVNAEVLLDTKAHILLALLGGELRRNRLLAAVEEEVSEPVEEPRGRGWLAYTPPPLALPLNYTDTAKWNRWESKYVDGIFIAATVLDRQHWPSQDDASRQQVGDLGAFEGGEVRGFRIGAAGTINFEQPWVYTIAGATHAFDKGFDTEESDSFTWFDYRLDIPMPKGTTLSVGKQKEPISMERIMSMVQLPMQERTSVSDALLPSRNFGAVMSGNALGQKVSWASGIFNDAFDTSTSLSNSSSQVVGRVTWLPFETEDGSNLFHLGLGARFSNGREGVRFRTSPEFNKAPDFVDTGEERIDANDMRQYNLEASWRRGPYWVAAEYLSTDVDSPTFGDLGFRGYHITASWILSGEMRSYNKRSGILGPVPVARSVKQGGSGAWEAGVRWSSLDLTDGVVDGGEMDILSLGINWWLTPVFNVNLNYRHIMTDRGGLSGESDGVMGRVLLMLE